MYTNLFYFNTINSIGGVETFFWQLARKYGQDYDITILYRRGDPEQIRRLQQFVRTRRYRDGEIIRCKRAFFMFNLDLIDKVEADEYYQMLHGDYKAHGIYPDTSPKIQHYISVSEVVRAHYFDGTDRESEVCYNPFIPEKPGKVLNLISATRLTPDKGYNRMEVLAHELEEAGVKFLWHLYTDTNRAITSPNIILHRPRLDILDFIANADYYVQLSDAEGFCYSVVEALSVGTPVIVTDFPVAHEIGVEHGKNGFILPMDMSQIPIKEICKGLKKFRYEPPKDRWPDFLLESDPNYEAERDGIVRVRCKRDYFDLELQKMAKYGDEWNCTRGRAEVLFDLNLIDFVEA